MTKQLFISYSSNDLPTAEKICHLLESDGIGCWIAPRDVMPGAIYAEEIITAIENVDAFLLICSRYTNDSVHVRSEVEHAFSHRKKIFPVRIEDVELGKAYEYFLGSSHWLTAWDRPLEECVQRLVETVRASSDGDGGAPTSVKTEGEKGTKPAPDADPAVQVPLNNLPAQTTTLIGREKEVEEISRLLTRDDVRLVTLTGPGGIGKTRLGLRVAERVSNEFDDGVFFVSLAPITDEELVPSAIAQVLGVFEKGEQSVIETLFGYLKNRVSLLLLDNFEQIIAAGPYVAGLLASCGKVKILVTSRQVLHLRGEYDYPVPPLAVPADTSSFDVADVVVPALEQCETVRLFIDRATAAKPSFMFSDTNSRHVAEICRRLDGLPLAIELAVARIRYLTPQAILERLGERLPALGSGALDLPERQRTLEATIDWSYNLLDESEKILFRRLAVFVGGFTLDAAEKVCDLESTVTGILESVGSLVDKNLLKEEEMGGEPWFFMLELIREYALIRLHQSGEYEMLRLRHSDYYLELAAQAEKELHGPDQVAFLKRLKRELDNFRASLTSDAEGDSLKAARTGASLWWFFFRAGIFCEGYDRLTNLLISGVQLDPSTHVKLLFGAAFLSAVQGRLSKADELSRQAFSLATNQGDAVLTAWAYWVYIIPPFLQGDTETVVGLAPDAIAFCEQSGDKACAAEMMRLCGWAYGLNGNYERSEELFEKSIGLFHELGDKRGIGISLQNHASCLITIGEYERSRKMTMESLAFAMEVEEKWNIAWALDSIACIEILDGGNAVNACTLFAAFERILEDIGTRLLPIQRPIHDPAFAAARNALCDEVLEKTWEKGRRMSLDQAIEFALSLDMGEEGAETV